MRLADAWRRFKMWVSENVTRVEDELPIMEPTSDWQVNETQAKETEFKETADLAGNTLIFLAASVLDAKAGITGGPAPTQTQVQDTAADMEAGFKFLAIGVVAWLIIKKIFL